MTLILHGILSVVAMLYGAVAGVALTNFVIHDEIDRNDWTFWLAYLGAWLLFTLGALNLTQL